MIKNINIERGAVKGALLKKKQGRIIDMFNAISSSYDTANHILSFGIDKHWRNTAIKKALSLYKKDIDLVLDVACGTGDLTHRWSKVLKKKKLENADVIGIDLSEGMLKVAEKKFEELHFMQGDATKLPFDDGSIDILSIAYGIRNVPKREEALKEFHRVLKKGGLLVILEFMKDEKQSKSMLLKHLYMQYLLPFIGGMVSRNKEAYQYLRDSIAEFITADEMKKELKKAEFSLLGSSTYTMNMSDLFIAKKK